MLTAPSSADSFLPVLTISNAAPNPLTAPRTKTNQVPLYAQSAHNSCIAESLAKRNPLGCFLQVIADQAKAHAEQARQEESVDSAAMLATLIARQGGLDTFAAKFANFA